MFTGAQTIASSPIYFSPRGFVGIGTTQPQATLDVSGTGNFRDELSAPLFTGSGAGLTGLNPANLTSGTAGISITGNAATATGFSALSSNTTGSNNPTVGYEAGETSSLFNANFTGASTTFLGSNSGPGVNGENSPINNATAIGANAPVSESNALVLGSICNANSIQPCSSVNVGIGTATPGQALDVEGGNVLIGGSGYGLIFSDGSELTSAKGLGGGITNLNLTGLSGSISNGTLNLVNNGVLGLTAATGITNTGTPQTPVLGIDPTVVPELNAATNNFGGNLVVAGNLNPDSGNANNGATLTPEIYFGNNLGGTSGEGFSSPRTSGPNQFGLNFYTNYFPRMSVTNSGLVGVGTLTPTAQLDVEGAAGASGANAGPARLKSLARTPSSAPAGGPAPRAAVARAPNGAGRAFRPCKRLGRMPMPQLR